MNQNHDGPLLDVQTSEHDLEPSGTPRLVVVGWNLGRQRDLAMPPTLPSSRGLPDPKEVGDRVPHPGNAIVVLPRPRQGVGARVVPDVDAIGGNERTTEPATVLRDEAVEPRLVRR